MLIILLGKISLRKGKNVSSIPQVRILPNIPPITNGKGRNVARYAWVQISALSLELHYAM